VGLRVCNTRSTCTLPSPPWQWRRERVPRDVGDADDELGERKRRRLKEVTKGTEKGTTSLAQRLFFLVSW